MSDGAEVLIPGKRIKAEVQEDLARRLVTLRYGLEVLNIRELDAYDDRNYHLRCGKCEGNPHLGAVEADGYVLKVINSLDSRKPGFFEAQNALLLFLEGRGFRCPVPVRQRDGAYHSLEAQSDLAPEAPEPEARHLLRLLKYRRGRVLEAVPATATLLRDVGRYAAKLDRTLREFSHPALEFEGSLWALASVPRLRDFYFAVRGRSGAEALVEAVVAAFEGQVLGHANRGDLEAGLLHGDLNENNLLVSEDGLAVEAVIDFGDSHRGCYLFELAVCLCYMVTRAGDLGMARHVIEGYEEVRRLPPLERRLLGICVCARLAQSLVLGTYSYQREPDNPYLVRTQEAKWALLEQLWPMPHDQLLELWKLNC